jgi:hypothetical protein
MSELNTAKLSARAHRLAPRCHAGSSRSAAERLDRCRDGSSARAASLEAHPAARTRHASPRAHRCATRKATQCKQRRAHVDREGQRTRIRVQGALHRFHASGVCEHTRPVAIWKACRRRKPADEHRAVLAARVPKEPARADMQSPCDRVGLVAHCDTRRESSDERRYGYQKVARTWDRKEGTPTSEAEAGG